MIYRELQPGDILPPGIQWPMHGVVAVNEAGDVVGLCGFIPMIHLDPLWVREDFRGHPRLLKSLWDKAQDTLKEGNVPVTLGFSREDDNKVERIAAWAGGRLIPGKLFAFLKKE